MNPPKFQLGQLRTGCVVGLAEDVGGLAVRSLRWLGNDEGSDGGEAGEGCTTVHGLQMQNHTQDRMNVDGMYQLQPKQPVRSGRAGSARGEAGSGHVTAPRCCNPTDLLRVESS